MSDGEVKKRRRCEDQHTEYIPLEGGTMVEVYSGRVYAFSSMTTFISC